MRVWTAVPVPPHAPYTSRGEEQKFTALTTSSRPSAETLVVTLKFPALLAKARRTKGGPRRVPHAATSAPPPLTLYATRASPTRVFVLKRTWLWSQDGVMSR